MQGAELVHEQDVVGLGQGGEAGMRTERSDVPAHGLAERLPSEARDAGGRFLAGGFAQR